MTNQGNLKTIKPIWEVRAEMTAQSPLRLDLPITLWACALRRVLLRD